MSRTPIQQPPADMAKADPREHQRFVEDVYQTLKTPPWSTGDVKVTLKIVADDGWVLMNDGTIGNASSGGTTRAHADTRDLFILLWTNTTDANCAVSTGRGATAVADFAANKTIALPKALGRALACYGTGSGLTARALAVLAGSEDAVVVAHTHDVTVEATAGGATTQIVSTGTTATTTTLAGKATSTGVSGTGANLQPSVFLNVMVKL